MGQDEFHGEAVDTLNYVVNQSDYTVQTLINVTGYLSLAKTVNVAQFYLPQDVKDSIDKLNIDLNSASDTLGRKTHQNSRKIRTVFDAVYDPIRLTNITLELLFFNLKLCFICLFQEIIDDYCCNNNASSFYFRPL